MDKVADAALDLINEARKQSNLPPLLLDTNISSICASNASELSSSSSSTSSNTITTQPFERYSSSSSANCTDNITEVIWTHETESEEDEEELNQTQAGVIELISKAHAESINDTKSPVALNPRHTHVSFGYSFSPEGNRFTYIEAYIDRYGEITAPMDSKSKELTGMDMTVQGKVIDDGEFGPACCIVYHFAHDQPESDVASSSTLIENYYETSPQSTRVLTIPPTEIEFDLQTKEFSVPIEFRSIPKPGVYVAVVYLRDNVDGVIYKSSDQEEEKTNNDQALPDTTTSFPSSIITFNVSPLLLTTSTATEITDGTIEERLAQSYATSTTSLSDDLPISDVDLLLGVGLIVPSSNMEHSLFINADRMESGVSCNLSLMFSRVSEESNANSEGVTGIFFIEQRHEDEIIDLPEGYVMGDFDVNHGLNGLVDMDGVKCFMCLRKGPIQKENDEGDEKKEERSDIPFLVNISIVYGQHNFNMGGGYITSLMPESVCTAYGGLIYLCTKSEGAGMIAGEESSLLSSHNAGEDMKRQMLEEDNNSMGSISVVEELDDLEIDTDLTAAEMLEIERRNILEMQELEAEEEEDAEEIAEQQRLNDLQNDIESIEAERIVLTKEHAELHRKLAAYLANQKKRESSERPNEKESISAHELEKQYNYTLTSIVMGEEKLNNQKSEYDKIAIDLQTRLDEKEYRANEISHSFREFKREIARNSENSRTGKPMAKKVIDQFEENETKKDEEAERVRLKNINLRMTLKKLDNLLRAKEQLAEGLHLIDFEQLKIENQTLNEKIEERNEELHKLRKKNTTTVQVLTHIKEKLHCVTADNGVVRGKLSLLDNQLSASRDRLTKLKRERESVRNSNNNLKQKQGFANSDLLVVDYENRKISIGVLREQLMELKERHEGLMEMKAGYEREVAGQ